MTNAWDLLVRHMKKTRHDVGSWPHSALRGDVVRAYIAKRNKPSLRYRIRMHAAYVVYKASTWLLDRLITAPDCVTMGDLRPHEKIAAGIALGQHLVTEYALTGQGSHDDEAAVPVYSVSRRLRNAYYSPWEERVRRGIRNEDMGVAKGPIRGDIPDDEITESEAYAINARRRGDVIDWAKAASTLSPKRT